MTLAAAASWEVPEPRSVQQLRMVDGATIILRRHGNPDGARLVLSHGNGLAIDLYYPFWSLLLDEFDLILYDLRNHGWNAVGDISAHNVPVFARDHDHILHAIDDLYGTKPTIGVFHSVSALASLLSSTRGEALAALVLFDPPLCRPGVSEDEFEAAAARSSAAARRRTDRFRSREELAEALPFFPTFARSVPGVCDLVARTTLRRCADGNGYELRCPREFEAQIIDYAAVFALMVDLMALRCPTKVIGADPTLPYSFLPTFDCSEITRVDYDFLPEATHLMQLEKPQECATAMLEFLNLVPDV